MDQRSDIGRLAAKLHRPAATFPGWRLKRGRASVDPPSVESQPGSPAPPPFGPQSVHGKLLRLVLTTLLLVTSSTLVIVAGYSMRLSRRTLAELEAQIRSSIEAQGHSLVTDQAVALRSLVTDNAFGDVAALVKATRDRESDVVYGLFVAADGRPWAWVSPEAPKEVGAPPGSGWRTLGVETSWTAQRQTRFRTISYRDEPVFEFSAPVVADDGVLGTILYGLSSARLRGALQRARADARYAALRTVALLGLLGVGGLALGFLLARRAATRITAPIAVLTVSARRIAMGERNVRVDVRSGDEVETLADAFNAMVRDLADAYHELERLNQGLEQRVRERTAELRQVNSDLESFTYSVSHDLRAPLRAIDAFAQIIEEDHGEGLPTDARELFTRMRGSTRHMATLIDNLLNLSRIGRAAIGIARVDLRALATSIVEDLQAEQQQRTGPPVQAKVADLPPCQGDVNFLRQVLVNLISNAFKFTQKSDPAIVEVGHTQTDHGPAYFVRDNGAGFDMQYADKLFGVFQRLHRQTDFPGTGVGLSIVKRIVQKHGGTVWAESAPGKGAVFYFTLAETPAGSAAPAPAPAPTPAPAAA
jgi:signal transduction histidine kinase